MRDQRISISNFLGVELLLLLVVLPTCFMSIVNALDDDDVKITEVSHPPLPAANLDKENRRNKRSVMELGAGILTASNTESITETTAYPRGYGKFRIIMNEFSQLSLGIFDNYVQEYRSGGWGQQWKFVDGGLLNTDLGKCVAGKGWYIRSVDCAGQIGNNGRWTFTWENRQIKSGEGYCLSSSAPRADRKEDASSGSYYVYYDYCRDNEPRQRWRVIQTAYSLD